MVVKTSYLAFWRLRQEDHYEFEASQDYTASTRLARATKQYPDLNEQAKMARNKVQ